MSDPVSELLSAYGRWYGSPYPDLELRRRWEDLANALRAQLRAADKVQGDRLARALQEIAWKHCDASADELRALARAFLNGAQPAPEPTSPPAHPLAAIVEKIQSHARKLTTEEMRILRGEMPEPVAQRWKPCDEPGCTEMHLAPAAEGAADTAEEP